MPKRDWSLVFFTTLAQWSVGIILCLTWLRMLEHQASLLFDTGLRFTNPVVLAMLFIGSATLSSFLHLGKPSNAPRALNNLPGSWLSREILAIGVFFASLLIILVLGLAMGDSGVLKYPLLFSSFCGLALLWTMSRIYMMPTIPAWNSRYTPLSFVTSAASLGFVTCLAMHMSGWVEISGRIAQEFPFALAIILLIEIVSGLSHQSRLIRLNPGIDALVFDRGAFYRFFVLRMAILIIACLALIITALNPELLPGGNPPRYLHAVFGLIIAQELMGRHLFFSSYFRTGV